MQKNFKKGDIFFHKEHGTLFMIHDINLAKEMYTLFFPTGHPNRDKPWARYNGEKLRDVAMKVTDKQAEKTIRILYGRQGYKS